MFKKKKKDADLFMNPEEDWASSNEDDFGFDDIINADEDDALVDETFDENDAPIEDYSEDDAADELRYQQHLKLKKQDKIFNNSWNSGEGISEEGFHTSSIKLDPAHTDSHLLDSTKFDQYLDKSIIERDLTEIIRGDAQLSKLMMAEATKKFSKPELNLMFAKLHALVMESDKAPFITSIDVLDFVSMISQLDFKRLFESLDYEHKETLLVELDKKFGILDGKVKFKKLF